MSESLQSLARRGAQRRLSRGAQLIIEGDRGDTLFIVLAGQVRAYSVGADGREITFGEYGPGEYVGEMSLDGGLRSVNVETTMPTTVVLVTRPTLEQHLREEPQFAFELLSKVIRRARHATLGMKSIALNTVYGRLKVLLEERAVPGDDGLLHVDLSHKQISEQLGCSRPMVSRLLKDLERGGVVRIGRHALAIARPLPAKW